MLLSMTGFGKAVMQEGSKKFTVELKSLNSKQMDLSSKVPISYREQELELRGLISKRLERGKVDFNVYIESSVPESSVTVNEERVIAYKNQLSALAQRMGIPEPSDWLEVIMRLPETIKSEPVSSASKLDVETLVKCTDKAIDELIAFRRKEGVKLEEFFAEKINNIWELLRQVPKYENERVVVIRQRIEESLKHITIAEYDKGRLEQEMIYYIEKLDISEEKQRLSQHLNYFIEVMNGKPGQGKKLGFLTQEMGREINTMGSKSNQADMQNLVVMMKDELEQIKEQVLNVM
ncbi:MAG: YicC family protein [Muribaculaceae bacterium]|nr:YicC family protein [Muribaculaceae bacterium]